jgi:hypothetical protein
MGPGVTKAIFPTVNRKRTGRVAVASVGCRFSFYSIRRVSVKGHHHVLRS